jgi:hypothetical protein
MISHIWIGMIIAISFMEAWIKFRAETSIRALTLDIGRTGSCAHPHYYYPSSSPTSSSSLLLLLLLLLWCSALNSG